MKSLAIIFFTFILIGCGVGGGGSDESPESTSQVSVIPSSAETIPLVIIQVEFDNISFTSTNHTWSEKIFTNIPGSLTDYFLEISNKNFAFIPASEEFSTKNDGIITVHLNKNHPGDSQAAFTSDLVTSATLADAYIDFSSFDENSDGRIQKNELQIMFLVAGGEVASGDSPSNSIWAHAWCLNGVDNAVAPTLDGTLIMQCNDGGYSRFGERHNIATSNVHDATIGIIAHELGHAAFSITDLYDTENGIESKGIGSFGLMGIGSWGYKAGDAYAGQTPVHMSAYSKIKANFITSNLVSLNTNNYTLEDTSLSTYNVLQINTNTPGEYFLVENRSASGYDAGLFSLDNIPFNGGIAVWHIDETQSININANNRLVDLEEADIKTLDFNFGDNTGDRSNLFYAGNGLGEFSDTSAPSNSKRNNTNATDITLTNPSAQSPHMHIDLSF